MKFDFSTHFKNSMNIINLIIVKLKSIKKRRKTIIAAHFNSIFISFYFFKMISSSSNSLRFRYTTRTTILIVDRAFKLRSNFNNIQFIILFIICKSFADRYNVIIESKLKKLNDILNEATIKTLKAIDALLNCIYNYSKKMNARLNAIIKNVNNDVESKILKIKNAIFKSIAKFVVLFNKKLNTLIKTKLKLRKNIAFMKQKVINVYIEVAAQIYKTKNDDFYDELIIIDN